MPVRLVDLPFELLSCIFQHLDFRDVLRCRGVCAGLKHLVDEDVRMRYKVELAVAGMKDGAHSALTVSERLAVLEERRSAWTRLAWKSQEDIPAAQNSAFWEFYGGVFAEEENRRTIHFWQLPSQIRGLPGRKWTLDDVGVRMSYFGMDPAQDLLVIVEDVGSLCRIHLRSMTTGMVHPKSIAGGVLVHVREHEHGYTMQISDDYLAILLSDRDRYDSELIVYNWKTGATLLHITDTDIFSFVFLTRRYGLLLAFGQPEADVAGITRVAESSNLCLLALDLDIDRPARVRMNDLQFLCAFSYPDIREEQCSVTDISLRADPGPSWTPSPSLAVPFSVSGEDRLLVVALSVTHGGTDSEPWDITISTLASFIPSETLLSAIKSLKPGQTGKICVWEDWGIHGSRFEVVSDELSFAMPCFVHGTSFACHMGPDTTLLPLTIELYDFNPVALRRALSSRQDTDGSPWYYDDASTIVTTPATLAGYYDNIFKDTVTTYYPYFRRAVKIYGADDPAFDALLLGEDSLILVSSESVNPNFPFYRVLSF